MEVVLKKIGASTVLVLPHRVVKRLRLGIGQRLTLHTTVDGKIILTPQRKYRLAQMIARCNFNAAPPGDLALWEVARPAGDEVW